MHLLTHAINFSIPNSALIFQSIMSLVWHPEESIRTVFVSAFISVFLTDGAASAPLALTPIEVVSNLLALYSRCQTEELISLERLVGESYKLGAITLECIDLCWAMVFDNDNAASALQLLAMIGCLDPSILHISNVERLIQHTSTTAMDSPTLVAVCKVVAASSFSPDSAVAPALLHFLRSVLMGRVSNLNTEPLTRSWYNLCEEALSLVFALHTCPDAFTASVLVEVYASLHAETDNNCSVYLLSRFVFIFGQFALNLLIYVEKLAASAKKVSDSLLKSSAATGGSLVTEVDAMEEEMGMTAAADADHERSFTLLTEKLLLSSDSLLGKFLPIIAYIAANTNQAFDHRILRETSVLALCRCMSISSEMCAMYLPLLFTILQRETVEVIQTSIIVAVGDLAFRFPNAVEPWTPRLYSCLASPSGLVRYNALMVLTHLILNDMIKVKGQVCHVVLCLIDSNTIVSDLARVFFNELSKRSHNPIYNLLGDIIAVLSRDAVDPSTESVTATTSLTLIDDTISVRTVEPVEFELIMSFLLEFISSEKLGDALADRLTSRLSMAESMPMRRKFAYCLSRLPISEKAVKKFNDNIR